MPSQSSPRRGNRGRAIARHGDSSKVTVTIDPKRKAEYERLIRTMESSVREEALGFDAYWEAVGTILDAQLFVVGGFESADAFLAKTVKEPRRTALRLVRVARYASPAEEALYGTTILDAALSYIETSTGGPIVGKLPVRFEALRIPVERDGESRKLALDKVTLKEISAATRALTRKKGASRARSSPAEQQIVDRLQKVSSLANVTVNVSGGLLRVGGVPLAALQHFVEALRGLDLKDGATTIAKKRSKKTAKRKAG